MSYAPVSFLTLSPLECKSSWDMQSEQCIYPCGYVFPLLPLMTSHDKSFPTVSARSRYTTYHCFDVHETSPGKSVIFHLIYPLNIQSLAKTIVGLQHRGAASSCQTLPSYKVSIRRTKVLPPASFSPHLTVDPVPLAVGLLWSYRTRDFHPLDYTHAGRPPKAIYRFFLPL